MCLFSVSNRSKFLIYTLTGAPVTVMSRFQASGRMNSIRVNVHMDRLKELTRRWFCLTRALDTAHGFQIAIRQLWQTNVVFTLVVATQTRRFVCIATTIVNTTLVCLAKLKTENRREETKMGKGFRVRMWHELGERTDCVLCKRKGQNQESTAAVPTKQDVLFFLFCTLCKNKVIILLDSHCYNRSVWYPTSLYLPVHVFPVYMHCIKSSIGEMYAFLA